MIFINTDHPITNRAAKKWGLRSQLNILLEECAEVIQAVSKINRALDDDRPCEKEIKDLAEEIGDVFVCTKSVIPLLGIKEDIERSIGIKLTRLLRRMDKDA